MQRPEHWLLLRGLSREQRHWGDFPDRLAAATGASVHLLDLPGAGTEHARRSPASVDLIADDVRARWLPLRDAHPGSWGIVGPSLGGMVTLSWVGRHPDDFTAVVVANTSSSAHSRPWKRMDLWVVPTILRAAATTDRHARERLALSITTSRLTDPGPVVEAYARLDRPMARASFFRQVLAASRWQAPASIAPRLLVLASANDRLCDPGCPKRLAEFYGAPLEVHPDAGHDLSVDDPDWFVARIATFAAQS